MIESLKNIQSEINYVLDRTSLNDPIRNHLIIAEIECQKIINNFINDGK